MRYKIGNGILYNEDCRDTLRNIDINTIDFVVTSPPYNVGIPYDSYDDGGSVSDYWEMIKEVFTLIYQRCKIDSRLAINIPYETNFKNFGGERTFFSAEFWSVLKSIGFKWAGMVDLHEDNPHRVKNSAWGSWLSPSAPYVYNPKECLLIVYKEQWKKQNKGTPYFSTDSKKEFIKTVQGGWVYKAETQKLTEANFSLDIPLPAIKLLTWGEDLVYDPFMGSGTTALACEILGRRWIGSELSPNYTQIAKKRIENHLEAKKSLDCFFD